MDHTTLLSVDVWVVQCPPVPAYDITINTPLLVMKQIQLFLLSETKTVYFQLTYNVLYTDTASSTSQRSIILFFKSQTAVCDVPVECEFWSATSKFWILSAKYSYISSDGVTRSSCDWPAVNNHTTIIHICVIIFFAYSAFCDSEYSVVSLWAESSSETAGSGPSILPPSSSTPHHHCHHPRARGRPTAPRDCSHRRAQGAGADSRARLWLADPQKCCWRPQLASIQHNDGSPVITPCCLIRALVTTISLARCRRPRRSGARRPWETEVCGL